MIRSPYNELLYVNRSHDFFFSGLLKISAFLSLIQVTPFLPPTTNSKSERETGWLTRTKVEFQLQFMLSKCHDIWHLNNWFRCKLNNWDMRFFKAYEFSTIILLNTIRHLENLNYIWNSAYETKKESRLPLLFPRTQKFRKKLFTTFFPLKKKKIPATFLPNKEPIVAFSHKS